MKVIPITRFDHAQANSCAEGSGEVPKLAPPLTRRIAARSRAPT